MKRLLALAIVAGLSSHVQAQAQIRPGVRVRILGPGVPATEFTGTVTTVGSDSITVADPARILTVARTDIRKMEVSQGKTAGAGARRGMLWGLGIGAAVGALASTPHSCGSSTNCRSDGSLVLMVPFMALGGVLDGAIIGAFVGREAWQPVDLARVSILPTLQGTSALASNPEIGAMPLGQVSRVTASNAAGLALGDRVRVSSANTVQTRSGSNSYLEYQFVGILNRFDSDTVALRSGAKVRSVAASSVGSVDVSVHRTSHGVAGVLLGAFAGIIAGQMFSGPGGPPGSAAEAHQNSALGTGFLAGAVLGGLIGHSMKSDTWVSVWHR